MFGFRSQLCLTPASLAACLRASLAEWLRALDTLDTLGTYRHPRHLGQGQTQIVSGSYGARATCDSRCPVTKCRNNDCVTALSRLMTATSDSHRRPNLNLWGYSVQNFVNIWVVVEPWYRFDLLANMYVIEHGRQVHTFGRVGSPAWPHG